MTRKGRQSGFSLIEMMIAVLVGLILLAGVVTVISNSSRTQREIEKLGSQIENGRYAIELFQRELGHAGYYGEYYDLDNPSSLPDPCSTDPTHIDEAIGLHIQGYNSETGNPSPSCLSDAQHRDGTDILVVRRASTATTAINSLTAYELYLQSLSIKKVIAQADGSEDASNPGAFTLEKLDGTPANVRKLRTDIYFVGPDQNNVPTLKRLSLVEVSGSLTWRMEPFATGVEQLQLDYGLDSDGDGTATNYVTLPSSVSEWADVVSLRVHLVVRARDPTPGHTDGKVYDLGLHGSYDPAADEYRRRAFVNTIRLANPSLRRE